MLTPLAEELQAMGSCARMVMLEGCLLIAQNSRPTRDEFS